jgi:uncharacterized membrane protein YfcA
MAAKKRKLNIPLIKGIVMLVVGFFVAVGSALSGLGAQVAAAPMINWLLGFGADRAKGTALAFTLFAATGAAVGALGGGVRVPFSIAALIAVGGLMGALLTAKASTNPGLANLRRAGQAMAFTLAVWMLAEGLRARVGGPRPITLPLVSDNAALGALVIGLAAGALSQLLTVTTGVLVVPALIYMAGRTAPEAITLSLLVTALGSALPALAYSLKQSVDQKMGPWMGFGGGVGGYLGGLLLAKLAPGSVVPFIAFGLFTAYLSAWTLYRLSSPPPPPQAV